MVSALLNQVALGHAWTCNMQQSLAIFCENCDFILISTFCSLIDLAYKPCRDPTSLDLTGSILSNYLEKSHWELVEKWLVNEYS